MKTGPRRYACCVVCDTPVHEVLAVDPETRQPAKVGKADPDARQAVFRLLGGSLVHISVCGGCKAEVAERWHLLAMSMWDRIKLATIQVRDNPRGRARDDQGIRRAWIETQNRAIVRMTADPPISFIGLRPIPE